jgi:1,4-alpha-glucan branching enzyme
LTPQPDRGELALVLHTHMPYVEGYGTWPFGEEWLWEAMATCYLPLLDVLDRAPITLSITPVLCDQLEAPGVGERFLAFLRDVRRESHRQDVEGMHAAGHHDLAEEIQRAATDYAAAEERFEALGGDLLGALAPHARWGSAATHAVLPLLATDSGIRLQVQTGADAHRARFGEWEGGFWLPECAYAPWIEPPLAEAGVRAVCLDLTDLHGRGAPEHLRPVCTPGGLVAAPIDRATIELMWSADGYPAHGTYRDYHHHTYNHHQPWANDGSAYDHDAALALAREHAADFVARAIERLDAGSAALGRPGLCVCAFDTELLGHWWYEGGAWLAAVVDEAERRGLALTTLDDALQRHEPAPAPSGGLPISTWGEPRDLSTWAGPPVADLAHAARAAELQVVSAGPDAGERALRELLALQSSDWAFMVTRSLAGPYPRDRANGHREEVEAALAAVGSRGARVRNLAPHLTPAPLVVP